MTLKILNYILNLIRKDVEEKQENYKKACNERGNFQGYIGELVNSIDWIHTNAIERDRLEKKSQEYYQLEHDAEADLDFAQEVEVVFSSIKWAGYS